MNASSPYISPVPPRVLVVDNDDSFTGSLVQQLLRIGADVDWRRWCEVRDEHVADAGFVLLSPGPGAPTERPINARLAREAPVPIFGVCLGLQAMAEAFGGRVVSARRIVHGRTSRVFHDGEACFAGLPSPFRATRYHSLAAERATLPDCLSVTAWTADGEIMGLRHRSLPVEGVQFHPESVRTRHGLELVRNALAVALSAAGGARPSLSPVT
jgi:anthranilate synthase/aminodeoxychorismate synthase-like glutamine amidotransferase